MFAPKLWLLANDVHVYEYRDTKYVCVKQTIFWRFINNQIIQRPDYRYIDQVWNKFKNYKVFNASIYFIEVTKVFKQL